MALQSFTVSIGALRDVNNNDKNYVSGEAIYVKTIGGTFASIFRDLAGASEIAQDGLANKTNEKGQFTFFVEAGDYILEYQNQSTPVTIVGVDYFNNRVEETVSQIIIDTATSRGFRVVGDFAGGFTYELPNDVAIDADGNYWAYADVNTLPVAVSAGTTPTEGEYSQRTWNSASAVLTNTGESVQEFVDSFALKIFQSPTDGGLTEIKTRTVSGGEVYEVRKTSDDSLATIYSDATGTTEIVQNGIDNKSGSDGVVNFYIGDGDYYVEVDSVTSNFITEKYNIDTSIWCDRYVGTFASGFTYTSDTDVARGKDGKYYHYIGNDNYPVPVMAGTVPGDFSGLFGLTSPTMLEDKTPYWYGAKGDGIADDTQKLINANEDTSADFILFTKGVYNITSDVVFTKPVKFNHGAKIKVSGGVLTFEGDVEAGEYQIVETSDNFLVNRIANTSVKFKRHLVKAEWLGAKKVSILDNIKTIPDQTGNLLKAYRAAIGDFIYDGRYINENPISMLKLGTGYYRVDDEFNTGYSISGDIYHMDGSGIVGDGVSNSFLIRTDLESTLRILSVRYYTGELTVCKNFKVTAYDPDKSGSARYLSKAASVIWCQGDSLFLDEIWASGAQVPALDTNGVARNGVGFQFESCVDTFFGSLFAELCATNYAFSSSIVKGVNATSFGSYNHNIGIGNFVAEWPDTQTTGCNVHLTNLDCRSVDKVWVHVLSRGDNKLNITGANVSGIQTGTGNHIGTSLIYLQPNARLSGTIDKLDAESFGVSLLFCENGSIAGSQNSLLSFGDVKIKRMLNSNPLSRGVIYTDLCSDANVVVKRIAIEGCRPALSLSKHRLAIEDVVLSGYQGVSDGGTSRQLFVQNSGELFITRIKRDSDDLVPLTAYGYQQSGAYARLDLRSDDIPNSTRVINGAGTKEMVSTIEFA